MFIIVTSYHEKVRSIVISFIEKYVDQYFGQFLAVLRN